MVGIKSKQEEMESKLTAERAAREIEEARKRELMTKIKVLEDEISECQELISSFSQLKGQIEILISKISGYSVMNLKVDLNSFSGITASAINEGMTDAQSAMEERGNDLSNVNSAIETQIGLLKSYIIELNSQIANLQAAL